MGRCQKFLLLGLIIVGFFCFIYPKTMGQLYYLKSIKKIDIHTHIVSDASYLREVMDELNMKFFTICTRGVNMDVMNFQVNTAKQFCNEYPRYYAWSTTFDLTQRNEPDWVEQVKGYLKDSFDNGAVAVKVWKEIGMEIKNSKGEFIQIDDPMFTPIFNYIAQEGKPLFAHIGEPIQAWMPLPIGPGGKPTSYWANNPEWHFWDKPDKPSYNHIMAARDHILANYSNLKVIGCHLGSVEFDVDELAKRFDKYPNFAVDTAARINYLMGQQRGKVRAFLIKYQDRILYGTDMLSGGMINIDPEQLIYIAPEQVEKIKQSLLLKKDIKQEQAKNEIQTLLKKYSLSPEQAERAKQRLLQRYLDDFVFYSTDDEISMREYSLQGLALPKNVLQKIFYENAVKWIPGVNKDF
jgi:predicted TIM-barrel fold metal-dependent hydrolase